MQLFEDKSVSKELIGNRKFNFMVQNCFMTSTLGDLLTTLNVSNESVVEVFYLFALEKPKPTHTSP